jgi:hypothetical protein
MLLAIVIRMFGIFVASFTVTVVVIALRPLSSNAPLP